MIHLPTYLLLTSVAVKLADAFSPKTHLNAFASRSHLAAIIYAPSWESESEEEANSWLQEDDNGSETLSGVDIAAMVTREELGRLARLCVAFSPPQQVLDLKNIADAHVLSVDENHMDIEAVVCDQESCVTLAVPVTFPKPCSGEGMKDCVLDNLSFLDKQAEGVLREMEWKADYEENSELLLEELSNVKALELPSWWVAPAGMTAGCDEMQQVLNRVDFEAEVKALAAQALAAKIPGQDYEVIKSTVIRICPKGMYLRASAKKRDLFEEHPTEIVDLSLSFQNEVREAESLRSAVLAAVASATTNVA